jgi:nucleoside-diphosphate-sugar epimerase
MSRYLLLTGSTGLVGQYLLRDLLLEGVPVAALIRRQGEESAPERLEQVMRHWETKLPRKLPRPVCLEGDITLPGLGLTAEAHRWAAKHCSALLHNAASLTFFGKDPNNDPWLSNLTGTENVLHFCRQAGVRHLHYMSTAYVCGKRAGTILESDLEHEVEFRNDYEHCKFEAEKLVRSACETGDSPLEERGTVAFFAPFLDSLTVYRPATIVGDSQTGYTTTYHGLYSYFQFAWMLRPYANLREDGRWCIPLRLNLTGDECRNLIPVDWVSAVTTHLVLNPKHHGRTYHLTPLEPVTAREIEEAMCSHFGYYGPTFVGPDGLAKGDLNEVERRFYEYVDRYAPYWTREPVFDCTNTRTAAAHLPCPRIDLGCLHRLIDFAIQDRWGKGPTQRPERSRRRSKMTR